MQGLHWGPAEKLETEVRRPSEKGRRSRAWGRSEDQQQLRLGLTGSQAVRTSKGKQLAHCGDLEQERSLGKSWQRHASGGRAGTEQVSARTAGQPKGGDRKQPNPEYSPFHSPHCPCSDPKLTQNLLVLILLSV